ncbi:hypothetical protein FEM48_Zijuj01G0162900 [Ziziphus jujuba var. spinosa]|uniref:Tetratricopeptide repeat protein 1 n=1 Tax=Ziziphus jujuba var. spinosa TaxID=714518 RepID=A0A978W297_ZIZJJ|nr:hypothetical protein FEM48_Zijuj01G0162900 [Ziziphus jujuba var. spinosa]
MVLIELDQNPTLPKPSSSSSSTTADSAPNPDHRDAEDGFETASDGELGDSDNDGDEDHHHRLQAQQQQRQSRQHQEEDQLQREDEQIVSQNDDEELRQKALAQANDAKLEGNKLYVDGQYEEALSQYELALQFAPEMASSVEIRSTCYSNRAICFLKMEKYEDTIKECTKALGLNPSYMKALVRRAEAHEKLEHFEEAISDMKKILELDPFNDQAKRSIRRLQPLAEEKREKLKEEMIGKIIESSLLSLLSKVYN